ncbi:MAG: zinc-binding alcohol dehydrogenase family protein [Cellulosilyticaceae bacterium]
MKIVYVDEPFKMGIQERTMPIPKEGEALLRIKYCGICGSDVATYSGNQPFTTYPRIPGHEFSAEIIEINGKSQDLKPGMLVTANPYFNCGSCYSCKKGKVNCCYDNQTMGVQRDGSFSEYITMPIERIIPGEGLSAEMLAMIEPFSISYHAVKRGNIEDCEKVLVIGAGPIGIFAMMAAKLRGAKVTITDVLEERLNLALKMGADGIINQSKDNLVECINELTNGYGMDVCIEAVGLPKTFLDCIANTCFGGKIILIGNGKKETTFNHSILLKKELSIYGSRNSVNDFAPIIRLIKAKKLDLTPIITDIYPLEHVQEAFAALTNNDGRKAKVLVKF